MNPYWGLCRYLLCSYPKNRQIYNDYPRESGDKRENKVKTPVNRQTRYSKKGKTGSGGNYFMI